MLKTKIFQSPFTWCFIFLLVFLLAFKGFQSWKVYSNTLGKISKNYVKENGRIITNSNPFQKLTNENYVQWDGKHFNFMRQHMYDTKLSGSEYIYAFFPLFPTIWKILFLPPIGVLFLNFLLFTTGLVLLVKMKFVEIWKPNLFIGLLLPGVVVFIMPYSEATFFVCICLAFYGLINKNYWIYFIGMFLASTSRNASTVIIPAILCTEIYYLLIHRKIRHFFMSFFSKTAPIFIGILCVSILQLFYGADRMFKFYYVLDGWEKHNFIIPKYFTDWSHEGFGINISVLIAIILPIVMYLILHFFKKNKQIRKENSNHDLPIDDYLVVLSMFYLLGTTSIVVFFQNSVLHGLFRYTISTPFFYLLLFALPKTISNISISKKIIGYVLLFVLGILFMKKMEYTKYWNFSDAGFFALFGAVGLWLLQSYYQKISYKIVLSIFAVLSITWTAYMFNIYLCSGWIFT